MKKILFMIASIAACIAAIVIFLFSDFTKIDYCRGLSFGVFSMAIIWLLRQLLRQNKAWYGFLAILLVIVEMWLWSVCAYRP
jgi:hypothetical protein